MSPKSGSALTLALLMLVAPVATASWSAFGSSEPDNSFDTAAFNFRDPPGAATNRVYFNGWVGNSLGIVGINYNPNVATIGTAMEPAGIETYTAILGVWADCNGDGYVGLAESAAPEYPSSALLDTSVCPPSSGPETSWNGAFNYNGWVTELIPIGGDGGQPTAANGGSFDDVDDDGIDDDNVYDLRIIRDRDARVWGDYGKPNDPAPASPGTCPIRPFPRDTLKSSGGVLDYVDCRSALLERWNCVFSDQCTLANTFVGPVTVPGAGDPFGLRFSDDDDGTSGPAGQVPTFGEDSSDNAAVTLTDCGGEPLVREPTTGIGVPNPNPQLHDTSSPTVPGQLNATNEEFDLVDNNGDGERSGDCDTSNDRGADFYGLLEDDFEGVSVEDKRRAQFNMEFEDNGVLGTFRDEDLTCIERSEPALCPDLLEPDVVIGGRSASGGTGASTNSFGPFHSWFARVALVKGAPATVRADINTGEVGIAPGRHVTFYAYVGPTTSGSYALPGGSGTYGGPQCGGATGGVHNGWNCDASLWNRNANGTPQPETQGGLARPGMTYQLRDVDCADGSNDLGIPAGLPAFGPDPCA